MKTKLIREKGAISLISGEGNDEELATALLFEGTGMWVVTDIRLSLHRKPSSISGGLHADDFCSVFNPQSAEEREYAISNIKTYKELENGDIVWPTFENYHPGKHSIQKGEPGHSAGLEFCGYLTRDEAVSLLQEIKGFWTNIENFADNWRIDNPLRQPSASKLQSEILTNKILQNYEQTPPSRTGVRL